MSCVGGAPPPNPHRRLDASSSKIARARFESSFSATASGENVSTADSRARRYARAPIFMRFIAHVIDLVIVVVPVFVGVVVFITLEMNDHQVVGRSIALAIFLAVLYYTFAKDGRPGGQSFGKRAA